LATARSVIVQPGLPEGSGVGELPPPQAGSERRRAIAARDLVTSSIGFRFSESVTA
jgi:hypothetical protein